MAQEDLDLEVETVGSSLGLATLWLLLASTGRGFLGMLASTSKVLAAW